MCWRRRQFVPSSRLRCGRRQVFGPGVCIPAFLVGAAVTAALVKQDHLSGPERAFADRVFRGKVPYDRILKTNLVGLGDRPFTVPGPGGAILVNLGHGFDDPVHYTGIGGADNGLNAPGQLFIHELTHAWQIANDSFTPAYYCRAASTAAGTVGGDMSAYIYGSAGQPWGDAPSSKVRLSMNGFAGSTTKPKKNNPNLQIKFPPMDDHDESPAVNPYYRYLRDNIRTGIA